MHGPGDGTSEGEGRNECEVAIVGGGVIGCAIARELASAYDVCVLERGQVAGEATALAAGLVTMGPSYADVPAIARYATDFFENYDGTGAFAYTERPSVELLAPKRIDAARRRVSRHREAGLDVEFVERDEIAARYPGIETSRFGGAVTYRDTGWVDPYTFATTLAAEAKAAGARFLTGTAIERVIVENEGRDPTDEGRRAVGVEVGGESLAADLVIVAAGWRSADLLDGVCELPIRPYRTQCLVLEPNGSVAELPMGWVPGEHVYFRPEHNGDLLVGGYSFAEDDPQKASAKADENFREHVASVLPEVVRETESARFVDGWAGIDAATPDTRPIIDYAGVDGLLVASGFHGRGVMSAPVAARAIRTLLDGRDSPFPLDSFGLDRFESRSREFDFFSVSA